MFQLVQTARQVQSMYRSDNQRTTPVTILLLAVARPNTAKVETTDDWGAVYQTLNMNAEGWEGSIKGTAQTKEFD